MQFQLHGLVPLRMCILMQTHRILIQLTNRRLTKSLHMRPARTQGVIGNPESANAKERLEIAVCTQSLLAQVGKAVSELVVGIDPVYRTSQSGQRLPQKQPCREATALTGW